MLTPELNDFIRQRRAAGVSDADIHESLVSSGWAESDITQALVTPATIGSPVASAPTVSSSKKLLIPISLVILLLGAGSASAAYYFHKKDTTSAVTTPLPPASLKSPSSYSSTLETLTGWVEPGQTSCHNADMFVIAIPAALDATAAEQTLLGNTSSTTEFPKVQSDGTFSILVDKGKNAEVILAENPNPTPVNCLAGIQLASSTTPLIVNDTSTAVALAVSTDIDGSTAASIVKLKSFSAYQPFENYLTKNLPTAPMSTVADITNTKSQYYAGFSSVFQNYIDEVSASITAGLKASESPTP